ncbi:hypothetical protein [Paludisphaera sp.]|uniref:hypothetical protein n=1 Tax=Paludisphaera sp. TaxID=2017432 RepID=UPI00301BBAF4
MEHEPDPELDFLLQPGETVVWSWREPCPRRRGMQLALCGAVFAVMGLVALRPDVPRDKQGRIVHWWKPVARAWTAFGGCGIVAGLIRSRARPVRYVLTGQRAIVVRPRFLRRTRNLSFGPERMRVWEGSDGKGDVVFQDWPFREGFLDIEDVRRVESLVRLTLKKG